MDGYTYVALIIVISVILFLVFRSFFCWYFKQTEICELLKSLNEKLDTLITNESNKETTAITDTNVSELTIKTQQEQEKQNLEELKATIKSYDDLLNDPKIKEEADTLLKFYGKDAYQHYLEKKASELGLEK